MSTNRQLGEHIWKTPSVLNRRPFPWRFEKWLLTRPTLVEACHLTGA
jgi:hypothetical protein